MPEETTQTATQSQPSNIKQQIVKAGRVIRKYNKPYFVGLDGIVRTSFADHLALTGRSSWGNGE